MFGRRRRQEQPPADPTAPLRAWAAGLEPRWRTPVDRALASRDRFLTVFASAAPGPVRQRLESLLPVIDDAVQRVANTVGRAIDATRIAAGLNVDAATAELKDARRDLEAARRAGRDTAALEALVATLGERHRAIHAALNLADDAAGQLGELNVRLDTAVAHASTIVLRAHLDESDDLDRELDDVIVGLASLDEALRQLPG
jgi:hypothetical protein